MNGLSTEKSLLLTSSINSTENTYSSSVFYQNLKKQQIWNAKSASAMNAMPHELEESSIRVSINSHRTAILLIIQFVYILWSCLFIRLHARYTQFLLRHVFLFVCSKICYSCIWPTGQYDNRQRQNIFDSIEIASIRNYWAHWTNVDRERIFVMKISISSEIQLFEIW